MLAMPLALALALCLSTHARAAQGAGAWELPIEGASGYSAIKQDLYGSGDTGTVGVLEAGQGFTVLQEAGQWWYVAAEKPLGWVMHKFCLVNLPDILPSIVYNNTNTYSSMLKTSGKDIPGVTGTALYEAKDFNERLNMEQYIVPAMYGMAPKIFAAQKLALAEGNTLVIYEAFRPAGAHQKVYDSLSRLVATDRAVWAGVTGNSFTMGWFLAPAPYNHQRGTAIDASLAKVLKTEKANAGDYEYLRVASYAEYPMQTAMHELSKASAVFTATVGSHSETAWKKAIPAANVTEGGFLLQRYCASAGLVPLASEWWHFNDIPQTNASTAMRNTGNYSIGASHSEPPRKAAQ
jgi:D-alanyl-D-alanine dipeptidase